MLKLLKIALLVCAYVYTTRSAHDMCQTPDKQQGICKPLRDCSPLYSLLDDNLTQETTTFLRESHCGFEAKHPKVCCPNANATKLESTGSTFLTHALLPGVDTCGAVYYTEFFRFYVSLEELPWTAVLVYQADNQEKIYCGGTLISDRYVLTAAQCIKGNFLEGAKLVSVRLGENNFTTNPDCEYYRGYWSECAEPFIEVPVEKSIVHEEYDANDTNYRHDIALIRLNQTVVFTDFVRPICLPSGTIANKNYTGIKVIQHGWGINNNNVSNGRRSKNQVNGQSNEECSKLVGFTLDQSQLCGFKEIFSFSSCTVDIGGSVSYVIEERFNVSSQYSRQYAVAVTSAGTCDEKEPILFTKVGDYSDWILSKLEK
ncbi:hypothetical protein Zmor_019279 [Zophobas morio]|uniref:CLIP domain-containing serine protease n=1 Tax=Zophobas morio TaxID=2755281 RepID=A0AA38I1C6_9CUCU|nr:hypothetical protein Zmor_019279 [Zophobas morio]